MSRRSTPTPPSEGTAPERVREPDQPAAQGIDQAKLEAFLGRVLADWGATASAALVVIGDRLGLYKAMAGAGPLSPAELAGRTGTAERYVREWLLNQAAGGYVAYDPATGRYPLPPEQALALADEDGPAFVAGGFEIMTAILRAEPQVDGGLPHRPGAALGRARPGPVRRHGALLPPGLPGQPGRGVAPRPGGRRPQAGGGGAGGRRRLRLRRLGRSSWPRRTPAPASTATTATPPPSSGPAAPRRRPGSPTGRGSRWRRRRRAARPGGRSRVRPGGLLRQLPRHGRPGAGGPPGPRGARPGRHRPAGGAHGRRPGGGQPDAVRAPGRRPPRRWCARRTPWPRATPPWASSTPTASCGRCSGRPGSAGSAGAAQSPFNRVFEARP